MASLTSVPLRVADAQAEASEWKERSGASNRPDCSRSVCAGAARSSHQPT